MINPLTYKLQTIAGTPVRSLGFASQYLEEVEAVAIAFEASINYFFSYNLSGDPLAAALEPLLAHQRDAVFLATGSESHNPAVLQQYFDGVRRELGIETLDAFFAEYLSPQDSAGEIEEVLSLLQKWKSQGWIRYVGISTHNRDLALQFIQQGGLDVLMLRYNMAHRKAEEQVFPAAEASEIPVVAFTCTRWGQLLKGHPQWRGEVPTAADCYRFALHPPAVQVALTAPATVQQLQENLAVLSASEMAVACLCEARIAQVNHWKIYGDLIYGDGQDSFETQWI